MGVAMTSARCNRAVRVSVGRKSSANAGAFRSKNITRAGANTSFALGMRAWGLRASFCAFMYESRTSNVPLREAGDQDGETDDDSSF